MELLSEPNALTATTPPLRSAAVFTPGAVKKVKRMTLLSEAISAQIAARAVELHHRGQPHMHDVDAAGLQLLRHRGCRRSC